MTMGCKIKAARKRAGIKQAELARRLGIGQHTISQWEVGIRNPKLETLERIAAALDVPLDTFVECDFSAYTRHLEAERDAAVEALREHRICQECKYWGTGLTEPCKGCSYVNNRFEWRGLPEEVTP